MADVLTVQDLEAAKKHDTFHSEVITGRLGGAASGAEIDTATNAVTGQVQATLPKVLRDVGFKPASFNFVTGGTLGVSDADKCIYNPAPAGDNNWYSWGGALPHAVDPGTDPTADVQWVPRTDVTLRDEINEIIQFINLSAFPGADATGTLNSDAAMDAAISTGKSIILDGEDSVYLFTKPFYLGSGQSVIQKCKRVNVDFQTGLGGRNVGLFNHFGEITPTTTNVTVAPAEYDTTLTVADGSLFSDGDWVLLNLSSGVLYPFNADVLTPYANFLVQIGYVSGNVLYLNYRFGYSVNTDATNAVKSVTKINPVFNGSVVGLKMFDVSTSTSSSDHPSGYVRKYAVNCKGDGIETTDCWWVSALAWYVSDCDTIRPSMLNGNTTFTEGGNAYSYQAVSAVRSDCYKPMSAGVRHTADMSHTAFCHIFGGTGNDTGQTISMHGQYDHDCSVNNFQGGVISAATAPSYGNTCTRITFNNCNGRYLHIGGGGEYTVNNCRFREEPLLLKAAQINFVDTRMPVAFGAADICVPDTRFGATKFDYTRGRLYLTTSGDNQMKSWNKVSFDGVRIVNQQADYALITLTDIGTVIFNNAKEIFNASLRVTGNTTKVEIKNNADIKKTLTGSTSEWEQFAIRDITAGNFVHVQVTGNDVTGNNSSSKWLAITNYNNAGGTTVTYQIIEGGNVVKDSAGINIPSDSRVTAYVTKTKDSYYNVTADVLTNSTPNTVASAATITIPDNVDVVEVTGSATITSITASYKGRVVTLKSNAGTWTLTDAAPLYLASNLVATSNDIITLYCDGAYWYELSRSIN